MSAVSKKQDEQPLASIMIDDLLGPLGREGDLVSARERQSVRRAVRGAAQVAQDALVLRATHHPVIPRVPGLILYGAMKSGSAQPTEQVAAGVAHVSLDTMVEAAMEAAAEAGLEVGVNARLVRACMPIKSVVPSVVAAQLIRITADYAKECLPGDARVARAALDVVALPGRALDVAHHNIEQAVVQALHAVGVKDEHLGAIRDITEEGVRVLGATMMAPDGRVAKLVGENT